VLVAYLTEQNRRGCSLCYRGGYSFYTGDGLAFLRKRSDVLRRRLDSCGETESGRKEELEKKGDYYRLEVDFERAPRQRGKLTPKRRGSLLPG